MAIENRVNSPSVAHNLDKMREDRMQDRKFKQLRREGLIDEKRNENEKLNQLIQEGTKYFNQEDDKAQAQLLTQQALDQIADDKQQEYVVGKLAKLYNELAMPNEVNELIATYQAKYLQNEELDKLSEFFEGISSKGDYETLTEQLINSADGDEVAMLDKYIAKEGLSKAQIYFCLNYLLNRLRNGKLKQAFQLDLIELINQFEIQESSYLFEFFSIQKEAKIIKLLDAKAISQMTELSSGNINLADLKQVVQFIQQTFKDKWGSMVSLYVKFRAKQLQYLTQKYLSPEDKQQISDLLKIEIYLQITHTLYLKLHKLGSDLSRRELKLTENYANLISQLLVFLENSYFADTQVLNLADKWGIGKLNEDKYLVFTNHLLSLIRTLPSQVFSKTGKTAKDIGDALMKLLRQKTTLSKTSAAKTVSFLTKVKYEKPEYA